MKTTQRVTTPWTFLFVASLAIFSATAFAADSRGSARQTLSFDPGWRFLKADAAGAEKPEFDDAAWRTLDVPHDWSIEGPFAETNRTGGAGAFLPSGIGWYRKHFTLPADATGRRVSVEFDGVMAHSDVWINGEHVGGRPFGYVSFACDLTGHLNFGPGKTNVLAVRADTSRQPASRWYSGAGVYRHVRLVVTDPVHIETWSTFITTPEVATNEATVRVTTLVTNESGTHRGISFDVTLFDPFGKEVGSQQISGTTVTPLPYTYERLRQTAATNQSSAITAFAPGSLRLIADIKVKNPQRWDLSSPSLYRAVIKVRSGSGVLDDETVAFGIRQAEFRGDTGFWLNGKNVRLYGVCVHHDGSAFGAAVPMSVWERRLTALRQLGVNAIRTAHNPPAPDFLDLCDRMGFLVMDEFFDCWTVGKNPFDYHLDFNEWSKLDARDTIRRDRNHPSVILYSVGNEIHDTPKAELAKNILRGLVDVCHENDPTRPVTQALFRPNVSGDYTNGLADMLDVIGTNYRDNELLAAQRDKPERKIVGTEQRHDRQTWLWLRDNPSHSGQFLWTGVDYLGESRRWPIMAAGSGLIDRTATPRPLGYERQSWWSDKPMVFMVRRAAATQAAGDDPGFAPLDRRQVVFPDWTPANLETNDQNVEVYSNCGDVELFLNGKSLGAKPINADASPRSWRVPFAPGVLKAVGRNDGKIVANYELHTAGPPAGIVLSSDHSKLADDWDDVACVEATVVDRDGNVVPRANQLIRFAISGPGVVAAVDSADNSSHEPFQAQERRAFQGRCFALVKASADAGRIVLTASAPDLKSATLTMSAAPRPAAK
jgi:beta-galactosidase